MRKELVIIMVSCIIGISSAYGDVQVNIEQSPGQLTPPLTVTNSSSNVLFQVLTGGQAIIDEFIQFSGSGLTALRTYVFPDSDGTVVLEGTQQTLLQKTIDADSNTLSNIDDNEIKTGAGIDVSKLSTGSVDNAEFDRLDGLTGNIQSQLNGKINDGTNEGTGTGQVFKDKSGMNLRFKTIKAGNNISIANNADDITIDAANTDGANVGTGTGLVFKDKSGNNLRFKTIKAGNNISIINNADDITINSTSVGIPKLVRLGTDLSVATNVIQDVTGLSFIVAANSVYNFNFNILYDVAAPTTGAGFSINCNGCIIDRIGYTVKQPSGGTGANAPANFNMYTRNATNAIDAEARSPYTKSNHVVIDGTLVTGGTGGTLIVRGISELASTPVTVKVGSNGLLYAFP